jgi:3-oxoacyl-[acyl-carrier protein] reductase
MDLGIAGRTALVMGASQGIGWGVAAALAREGARVAIASSSRERIAAAADEIDGEVAPFLADTDDIDRLARLPDGPPLGGALDHPREEWEAAYRSLVLAPRTLVEAALPGMRERRWGRIVNVGSSSVREPIPGLALSNAHRTAAIGLFKTLASEVAADGITVNTVATGRFATQRVADSSGSMEAAEERARADVPAGRLGTPEEYGDLVAFLCSERAAYLTGAVIPLDGGLLRSI